MASVGRGCHYKGGGAGVVCAVRRELTDEIRCFRGSIVRHERAERCDENKDTHSLSGEKVKGI
ncbi:hypothetical protein E2C01_064408 [Portunus trituberculatus]|uniref:Uncharacterized protein n=1 Tax=Portunus trituberculatus TaxID=210409 RepID=A0A5B7HN52_PORTR|nr:hypothetical protein [Portunus trituberculatus]